MYIGKPLPKTIERAAEMLKLHERGIIWKEIARRYGINIFNAIAYANHVKKHPELLTELKEGEKND